MNSFFQDYYQKLKSEIGEIEESSPDLMRRLEKTVEAIHETINSLKEHLKNNPFQTIEEEIEYFRNVNPLFLAEYIYYSLILRHEIEKISKRTPKAYKASCKAKLKNIGQFYEDNKLLILYYTSEFHHHDKEFFVRGALPLPLILDDSLMWLDKDFTTGYDMVIARSMAYDQFSAFLKSEIDNLNSQKISPKLFPTWETQSQVKWTSSKVNLVELMYALVEVGSCNDGNCEIIQLAEVLEKAFQIKLDKYYHTFTEIKERKQPTQFIDNLKEALLKKINEADN